MFRQERQRPKVSTRDFIASMIEFVDYSLESHATREEERVESGRIRRWLSLADQALKTGHDDGPPPPDL
ncbi:MAG: hypothetical protein DMG65_14800 [Candidatus Angelobacter sp. Gp1-AA117]|nr:MAG: hypothetical protein DMG65_14800 [Candidatus Angelobacter sp. Gp1-AA117]